MKQLVIAEHDHQHLKSATLATLSAAQQIGKPIDVLVAGYNCQSVVDEVAKLVGVERVIWVDAPAYSHFLAENFAALIAELAVGYNYLLAPASTFGKNILPRAAALLDVAQHSDIMTIIDHETFVRPIYAGNALLTFKALDAIKVLTIRSTAFDAVGQRQGAEVATIEQKPLEMDLGLSEFESETATPSARPELTNARVVIAGGRGLQGAEHFNLIEQLADCLHGAVGASRAAVDAGYAPNDYQVGQTGKVVAPELYIAIGISGAIQHIAGMKDSKVIVAINKDPDAPIFQLATYGVIGDLFQIVPELIDELDRVCKG